MAYVGLTERYEVVAGERTRASTKDEVPFMQRQMSFSSERFEVAAEMVYPYSPKKCFDMLQDYRKFLLCILKRNEVEGTERLGEQFYVKPMWVEGKPDTPLGGRVKYGYYMHDVFYEVSEKITKFEDGEDKDHNNDPIYRFGTSVQELVTKPNFPLKSFNTYMIFTTFNKDPNKCHVKFIKKWYKPYIGFMSMNDKYECHFQDSMQRELFAFKMLLQATYSPKLPKKDHKVAVIGAGPSGLHMAYELVQRGLDPENITFFEKDNRYGGKTLSIKSDANVQISDAKFNPPAPRLEAMPPMKQIGSLKRFIKTTVQTVYYWLKGIPPAKAFPMIERMNTPNALQQQPESEYFNGGEAIFHELGTCYLSPAYYAIRTLLKRVQGQIEAKARQELNEQGVFSNLAVNDLTREVGPDTYSIESPLWDETKTLEQWIVDAGKDSLFFGDFWSKHPVGEFAAVDARVLAAKVNYCNLHQKYLGNYSYTLPPEPDAKQLEDLELSFEKFLTEHKLDILIPLFTYALTAQGYGLIENTPTFLAMQWLTPDCLDGYFEWWAYFGMRYKNAAGEITTPIPKHMQKFDNPRKGMIVSGWGGLWDRIVALYNFKERIKFNTNVTKITRSAGKTKVQFKEDLGNGPLQTEEFDFLIVAAPMSDAADDPTLNTLKMELTPDESKIFLSPYYTASKFRTNLFLPKENGTNEADHLRIFIDAILDQSEAAGVEAKQADTPIVGSGVVFGVRDSYKAVQPRLSFPEGDRYDPTKGSPREKMCYQYVSPNHTKRYGHDKILDNQYIDFMQQHTEYFNGEKLSKDMILKLTKQSKGWTYYTHFEREGLTKGLLWKILDLQGKNNTLFVHASTNFESVLDIVNYNHMLLDGLQGRLEDFITPETDTRPEPWQRPQAYLANQLIIRRTIRYVLNFFIFTLWSIWYVISYPFAEGIYLRYQRYKLQEAFQTPELGSPWEYNMRKFNNVSPCVRGFLDERRGISNGIPENIPADWDPYAYDPRHPGDHVFRVLQAPKTGFVDKFPEIPTHKEVSCSIRWSLADVRKGMRVWLGTFDDTFQPLLTDGVQKFIQNFSLFFPNYYSWIFAWIFASQFRLLIGFSYRFEDEKGGGLRIPECHMLRQAIKDHGVQAGQRICLTVCKIFTEEVMREKHMSITFFPDFIETNGLGCTVRMTNPVNHAFTDHSTFDFRTTAQEQKFKDVDVSW